MEHIIRKASAADIDSIVDIERASFSDPWSCAMIADDVCDREFGIVVNVLEIKGKVAGYYFYYPFSDDLADFAIAPEYRRQGYGRLLLRHFLDMAKALRREEVFLEVRESNRNAIALYLSCGFREVGLRKEYYSNPCENAVLMKISLKDI